MISRLFFVLFALLIFWGLNAFFIFHIYSLFGFKLNSRFYLLTVLVAMLYPISMILHSNYPNLLTRGFYYLLSLWLGIIFIGFFISIIFDIIGFFYHNKMYLGYAWIAVMILTTGYGIFNQSVLVIKNVNIPVKNLEKEIKIGYLSDVHIDGIHGIDYLDGIVEKLNKMDLDVVLMNGDVVDGTSLEKHTFNNLDKLKVPVYITFGNHETYIGKDYALSLFKNTKARVLDNEVVDFNGLQILGMQDLSGLNMQKNSEKLNNLLNNMKWDRTKPTLLMLHEPVAPEIADKHGINVQVAGHTHNGQIWPFTFIVKQYYPYMMGLYNIGNLKLYVGPGSGVWGPPMRIGSRSEITLITLTKK